MTVEGQRFMVWLRRRPEFADLAGDAAGLRTLRALVLDMDRAGACADAQGMLLVALAAYRHAEGDLDGIPIDDMTSLVEWATAGE